MQAVGQLVGLRADETGLGNIHGLVQLPLADIGKGVAADLLQLGIDKVDKGLAAADKVLVEPGNALVHGVGHALVDEVVVKLLGLILHKQGVTALVEGGEDIGNEIILKIVGGDPHVAGAKIGGKGMLRGHKHQSAFPQTLQLQQIPGEGFLLRHRAGTVHEIPADGLAVFLNPCDKGHDALAQSVKERVKLGLVVALLVVVQTGIVVSGGLVIPQIDGSAGIVDQLSQSVPKQGEVVGLFGGQPLAVGLVHGKIPLIGKAGGNILLLAVVVVEIFHQTLLHRGQTLAVRVERLYQRNVLFTMGQLVDALSQHCHVFSGGVHAVFRSAALYIKFQLAHGVTVGAHLTENFIKLPKPLLVCHKIASNLSIPYHSITLSARMQGRRTGALAKSARRGYTDKEQER